MRVMAPARSAPTSLSSIFTMRSPDCMPAWSAGEPSIGPQHLHRRVLGDHFDADAGVGAHGGEADLFELVGVEEGGVRIERRDHAADRFLHELLVVDVVDVLALDALVDLGEQAGLFPRERVGRRPSLASSGRRSAMTSPAMAPEKPNTAPAHESDQRARSHRHVCTDPRSAYVLEILPGGRARVNRKSLIMTSGTHVLDARSGTGFVSAGWRLAARARARLP